MTKRIPLQTGFLVAKTPCKNCLFSDDALVSPEKRTEILEGIVAKQGFFICHCSSYVEGAQKKVCCRGFFDAMGHVSQMIRIATRLNVIRFVDLPPLPPGHASWRTMQQTA